MRFQSKQFKWFAVIMVLRQTFCRQHTSFLRFYCPKLLWAQPFSTVSIQDDVIEAHKSIPRKFSCFCENKSKWKSMSVEKTAKNGSRTYPWFHSRPETTTNEMAKTKWETSSPKFTQKSERKKKFRARKKCLNSTWNIRNKNEDGKRKIQRYHCASVIFEEHIFLFHGSIE